MKLCLSIIGVFLFVSNAYAGDFCSDILKKADVQQAYIDHSTSDYKVISNGRLYFYTAPDKSCKNEKVFIVPGDHVIGYSTYNGFISAAYFKKNGDSVDGWLDGSQLENTKFTNGPSSEEQMVFNMIPDIIQGNKLSSLTQNCLNTSLDTGNKDYYSVDVTKSPDKACQNEKTLSFTIIIKKHSLDIYTNQGNKQDEFRRLERK